MKIKLFVKKQCWRPTVLGSLVMIGLLLLLCYFGFTNVYRFLSVDKVISAKTMVVEGWVEDYVLKDALDYFRSHQFEHLIVTGIPITDRRLFANYKNTAQLATALIKQFGFNDTVYQAAIPTGVTIDRTYNTAIATGLLFEKHPKWEKRILIWSEGTHARRTKEMFEMALGKGYKLGIVANKEHVFDPAHFWRTSKGFRTVSNEFVAYVWVTLFFHPDSNACRQRFIKWQHADKHKRTVGTNKTGMSDSTVLITKNNNIGFIAVGKGNFK